MRVSQYSPVSPEKARNRRNPNRSSSSGSDRFRTRKKQKRLDNICEKEYTRNRVIEVESNRENDGEGSGSVDLGPELLRRSSRVRRAPVVLDASPSPVKKRRKIDNSGVSLSKKNDGFVERKDGEERLENPLQVSNYDESEEQGSWRLRLRSRVDNASLALKKKGSSPHGKRKLFDESNGIREELKAMDGEIGDKREGYEKGKSTLAKSKSVSGSGNAKGLVGAKKEDQSIGLSNGNEDENETNVEEMLLHSDKEDGVLLKSATDDGNDRVVVDDSSIQVIETGESKMVDNLRLDEEQSGSKGLEALEQSDKLLEQSEHEKGGNCLDINTVVADGGSHGSNNAHHNKLVCKPSEDENVIKVVESKQFSTSTLDKPPRIREGRRCGLCGRGTDGKPPKRLVRDFAESDDDAYGGSSSSEEANYDIWDGFGDEPGWLGRLLGPIHDRFGIADVWVHQHCAVWSPEVGFTDLAAFLIKLHASGLLEESCGCMSYFLCVINSKRADY